ncbi:MAG TPA: hypothetical protein VFE13_13950 [Caulobacteraceae bacterium]|jgi:hypothetical protein|nr:hypothetical protein [Caulobacteraceae bacterium]
MRKLDWFLAAVVVMFLLVATAVETANFTLPAGGAPALNPGAVGEVAVRRLVSRLPPPVLTVDPQ